MNNHTEKTIEISGLKAYYVIRSAGASSAVEVRAVDNVSLDINEGEILGITGESGCGKSTLSKATYGLVKPPLTVIDGSVYYNIEGRRTDVLRLDGLALSKLWWKFISYVPQGSMSVLNPTIRIKDQFLDIIKTHRKDIDDKEAEEMILKHIDRIGLPREVATSFPHQLSGGMRQRIVIALATALNSRVILADEPTTALDVVIQRGILQLLSKIQQDLKCTLVIVTHDMGVHAQIAHRVAVMYAGKLIELGPVDEVFKEPQHPYTRYLISSLPRIGDKSKKASIGGRPPSLANPPQGCTFHPRCNLANETCRSIEPAFSECRPDHYAACHLLEAR